MVRLLVRADAAAFLRKPTSWLRYAERHGLVPFVRVGRQIRYVQEDLEAWVARTRVAPDSGSVAGTSAAQSS